MRRRPVTGPICRRAISPAPRPRSANPLRSAKFYGEHKIDSAPGCTRRRDRHRSRTVELADGSRQPYDALLLATGAEPVRLEIPGGDLPHVHYLRTFADSRALVAKALAARRAVVMGASFIGLEVAASLRARGIAVDVVGPGTIRWSASWDRRSGGSSASSTKSTASRFISARRPSRSTSGG